MVGTICSPPSGCTRKHPPVTSNPLDEKAGLGLPEGFERLLEVAISSTQGAQAALVATAAATSARCYH
jgi:hypothetical protein